MFIIIHFMGPINVGLREFSNFAPLKYITGYILLLLYINIRSLFPI